MQSKSPHPGASGGFQMVGLAGFEPAASSSRTRRATKLRYSPETLIDITPMSEVRQLIGNSAIIGDRLAILRQCLTSWALRKLLPYD